MKSAITYDDAIAWIAKHEQGAHSRELVAGLETVAMVADLFGVNDDAVVHDVVARHGQQDRRDVRTVADVRRAAAAGRSVRCASCGHAIDRHMGGGKCVAVIGCPCEQAIYPNTN